MISYVRLCAAALGIATLFAVAGCMPERKTVLRVNEASVGDEEYNQRVQSVTSIPDTMPVDAGGMTMVNMIRDMLTEQLAQKYHAVPSDEAVNDAANYWLRTDPNTVASITAGKATEADLRRQKKYELEAFGIGVNGDQAKEEEVVKAYNDPRLQQALIYQASYTFRVLPVPDETTGQQILAELKRTGDFKAAAQKMQISPITAAALNKEQTLLSNDPHLPAQLRQALDPLKPNEFTPAPVAITNPNPQQPLSTQSVFVIAQLKKKEPERKATLKEVHFLLAQYVLEQTHRDWRTHYRHELSDFTKKSDIHIGIKRYEPLVDQFIRPQAEADSSRSAAMAPGSGAPAQ